MSWNTLTGRAVARQAGFSLLELIVAMGLIAIMAILGAGALRNYWLSQSLYGGRDELVSEFRRAQEQAVSESHPKVFGVRLQTGSSTWGLVEFDPGPNPDTCTEISSNQFQSGTRPVTASFTTSSETTFCQSNLVHLGGGAVADRATSQFVWFYARGTATGGTVALENPNVSGGNPALTVFPITGRVSES